jgi:tetratricopeptide (TPR) repeat protein
MFSINKFNIKKLLNIYFGFILFIILYFVLRSFASVNSSFVTGYNTFLKNIVCGFIVYVGTMLSPADVPVCLFNFNPGFSDMVKTIIFVALLIFVYYKNFINRKLVLFGLSVFVLYLLPTFLILQLFFHRLLLPVLGLILIFVLLIQKIVENYKIYKKYFIFLFVTVFLMLSYSSYLQANKYKNNEIFTLEGYKTAPEYHVFLSSMGNLYSNKQNYDKALEFKLLAEEKVPGYYLTDVAAILCYQKKFDEAEEILKKVLESSNQKEFAYANLSLIYDEKQDYIKSLEYAQKAYNENPYNVELSVNLARKYLLNEKYKEAIDIYLNLLKFKKKEAGYYYSIGFLYYKTGDKEKAADFVKKAVLLNNNNQKYKEFLLKLSDS